MRVVSIVIVALVGGVFGSGLFASTKTARGQFASNVVTEGCLSPVGICTAGSLTGSLKGDFTFTATSLVPTPDVATTGVLFYSGDLRLETKSGVLHCSDAGAFESIGDGAVSSVCTIVAGTGEFAGVTGEIQFLGNFTAASGGDGEYRAVLTTP